MHILLVRITKQKKRRRKINVTKKKKTFGRGLIYIYIEGIGQLLLLQRIRYKNKQCFKQVRTERKKERKKFDLYLSK
jgi:hypothetical protein